ncbi:MAG TPA: pitrilysin family protein [Hyphomicrobiaceae bacterium]|nr:pitrilysin family protein [Hyphomicrobiaceae bacterium]
MTTTVTALANGLRIASHTMPHLETTSLGVWVAAGARNETEREHGISHLLEHMAFKGTARRSARQIAEEIEEVGGELNAATSLETTAYYARVLKSDEAIALELLADILQNSSYAEADLEREREVILQEIAGIQDSPDEIAYDLVQDAAFPGQPVGRPIIGTRESVMRLSSAALRAFLTSRYVAPRMVIAAAGAIDHANLVRLCEALFGGLNGGEVQAGEAARYIGGRRASAKPFEQSHLLIGFKAPSYRDAEFYSAQVFSGLFGGGMSSRLFQEVRENRGLCYAIYSSAWALADTGLFEIHAATGAEMMEELTEVIAHELAEATARRPCERELQRAKAQLKAGLLVSLESSSARAEQMARQLLAFGRLLAPDELVQHVEDVTAERVRVIAESLATSSPPSIAVVGAGPRSPDFALTAERRLRV